MSIREPVGNITTLFMPGPIDDADGGCDRFEMFRNVGCMIAAGSIVVGDDDNPATDKPSIERLLHLP